jgi:hypothetical protein
MFNFQSLGDPGPLAGFRELALAMSLNCQNSARNGFNRCQKLPFGEPLTLPENPPNLCQLYITALTGYLVLAPPPACILP